jgi:carboxyl-terminal processing protease
MLVFTQRNKSAMIAPMKRGATIILLLTLLTGVVRADLTEQEAGQIAKRVGQIIGEIHYRQIKVNDDISRIHLDNYLNTLDFGHMIFMQSDVDEFKKTYGTRLDDEIKFGKIRPARVIYDKYIERLTQRQKLVDELLKKEMDYSKKERFNPMRNKLPWPKTQSEAEDLWRARIKYELLADKLTLSKDGKVPDAKKLKDSKAKIGRRYERLLKTMKEYERDDILETYLSALTRAYDPHSDYMSPHEAENFKINSIDMQLTGIGAVLRVDDGYTTIVRIMPGGPAGRSKLLHANDKVIAVQNPGDKEPTDVIDMKIDKVVQLIRGKKGSDVKLTIIPAGTEERKVITITRDVVKLEDQLAKAYIIEHKRDGKSEKLGVINLPGFYSKCSNHCRTLIERLKKEGVDGIVLDLRQNGGGILQEAINLTGLFIEEGPVVQVKDYRNRRRVMSDTNSRITYSGPLIVAVSHMSASASEIVAAALQDHGRAIVVGGKMTHGKGTVQQILPLSRAFNLKKDSGQLKFTISKFYRINGTTTQRDGVKPDIILPSVFDYLGMSEAELPRALESDEIEKAKYKPLDRVEAFFTSLRKASAKRINGNQDYKYIREDITRAKKQKEDRSVSLNENERRKERADNKTRIEVRNKERADRAVRIEKYFKIDVKMAEAGKPLKKLDAPKPKKENPDPDAIPEDDSNTFNLDPELRETLQILSDFVKLNSKLISQIKK